MKSINNVLRKKNKTKKNKTKKNKTNKKISIISGGDPFDDILNVEDGSVTLPLINYIKKYLHINNDIAVKDIEITPITELDNKEEIVQDKTVIKKNPEEIYKSTITKIDIVNRSFRKGIFKKHFQLTFENNTKKYYLGKLLGEGAFGKVNECNSQENCNDPKFVIKTIKYNDNEKEIETEIKLLKELQSICKKYILCYEESLHDTNNKIFYILTEYLQNYILLKHFIYDNKQNNKIYNTFINYEIYIKICNELLLGLKKIHEMNICHRDIKPSNIMIKIQYNNNELDINDIQIKYIDFGLSCRISKTNNNIDIGELRICGTPLYTCPLIFESIIPNFNVEKIKNCDYFSLGMVFIELITCKKLYVFFNIKHYIEIKDKYIVFKKIINKEINMDKDNKNKIKDFETIFKPILQYETNLINYVIENNEETQLDDIELNTNENNEETQLDDIELNTNEKKEKIYVPISDLLNYDSEKDFSNYDLQNI
jgi:serine/threonine protein kinase